MDWYEYKAEQMKKRNKKTKDKVSNGGVMDWDEYLSTQGVVYNPENNSTTEDRSGLFKKSEGNPLQTIGGTLADLGISGVKGALGGVENPTDLVRYGLAGINDLLGKEERAEFWRLEAMQNDIDNEFAPIKDKVEKYSVSGDVLDDMAGAVGYIAALKGVGKFGQMAGLGEKGVGNLVKGAMFTSAIGGGMTEAYYGNATDKEALTYGALTGTTAVVIEGLVGGLGKALKVKGFSDGKVDKYISKFADMITKNTTLKNTITTVSGALGEGVEEVAEGFTNAFAKKFTYMSEEDIWDIMKDEKLGRQFWIGTLASAVSQMPSYVSANKSGVDLETGLTSNEQKVVDAEVQNRISEQEKTGDKKLTSKDKAAIKEQVMTDIKKGGISIDTIESVLGGETYNNYKTITDKETSLNEQIKTLNNEISDLRKAPKTIEVEERYTEAKQELQALENELKEFNQTSNKAQIQAQLHQEVDNLTQNDRFIRESYNEKARVYQSLDIDLSKYDAKRQEAIKTLTEDVKLNNTKKTHEAVELLSKVAVDRNLKVKLVDKAFMQKQGEIEGVVKNAYITKDGEMFINIESPKYAETLAVHEVLHDMKNKTPEIYTELESAIIDFAKTKGIYESRLNSIKETYFKLKGQEISEELAREEVAASLSEDYIATDEEFVRNLSVKQPNVFKRIYEELKYLWKIATAGSKEKRQLEKAKKIYDKVYRESANVKANTTESVKTSTSNTSNALESDRDTISYDSIISKPDMKVTEVTTTFDDVSNKSRGEISKDARKKLSAMKNENGVIVIHNNDTGMDIVIGRSGLEHGLDRNYEYTAMVSMHLDSYLENAIKINEVIADENRKHDSDILLGYGESVNGEKIPAYFVISKLKTGQVKLVEFASLYSLRAKKIAEDSTQGSPSFQSRTSATISITDLLDIVNETYSDILPKSVAEHYGHDRRVTKLGNSVKFSLSEDTKGRTLTKEQQDFLVDSKVRDENGALKVMYHGTPNGDFTVFKDGTYFTENKEYADRYQSPSASSISSGKVASSPKTFEVYLNITKPFDLNDAKAREIYINDYIKGGNAIGINPYLSDAEYEKIDTIDWTEGEDLRDFLIDNGYDYDGLVLDEGADGGYGDEVSYRGKSYVIFNANQVKAVDNIAPTSDEDIRYSLSDVYGFKVNSKADINESLLEELSIHDPNAEVDENGNVTVYHRTSVDNANEIRRTGIMKAKEDALFFSSKDSGYASDYGEAVVKLKVPSTVLEVNDIFDGEVHFDIPLKYKNGGFQLDVRKYLYDDTKFSLSEEIYDYQSLRPKVRGGWTIEKIQKQLKQETSTGSVGQEFIKFDSVDEIIDNIFYHGSTTTHKNLKAGSTIKEAYRTGGYGEEYHSISLSKNKNVASNFTGMSRSGVVTPVLLRKGANVIEMPEIQDSIELEEMLPQLWEQKVDAVKIGDWDSEFSEQELVVLNPRAITVVDKGAHHFNVYQKPRFENLNTEEIVDLMNQHKERLIEGKRTSIEKIRNKEGYYKDITDEQQQESIKNIETSIQAIEEKYDNLINNTSLSLSNQNEDIAPTRSWGVRVKDMKLKESPVKEAPVREAPTESVKTVQETDYAPLTALDAFIRDTEQENPDFENYIPDEVETPYYEPEGIKVDDPFYERDIKDVGDRKVKAYMYENPEVKPFFQQEAQAMLYELENSIKGEKQYNDHLYAESGGEKGWFGTKRTTSDDIAYLLDNFKYTYADIKKGLNAIIEDNGKENNAVSKRIEFALNDRLKDGYTDFLSGYEVPANQDYINLLAEKQINTYSDEAYNEWVKSLADLPSQDIAPVRADITPVREVATVPYRNNKIASMHQNDLDVAIADDLAEIDKKREYEQIAEVLDETPVKESTRNKRIKAIIEANVLDKGLVFENLALKTKGKDGKYDRELEAKWNHTLYSDARAQEFIGSGAEGVKSLNDIIAEVENTDHKKDFYQYMYHKHNIDRMNLRGRYKDKNGNPMNNKPVFGDAVTSDVSKEIVEKYEQLYPEFKGFAQDVYDYMNHLRSLMLENGIITKETVDLWSEMYPNYVPINRVGENGLNVNVPLDTGRTGVNAPIKQATGGSSNILPLFDTMASRTLQTYKAIAKNSFGVSLKNALGSVVSDENADIDEVIDSIDSQDSLLQEGKNGKNPTFTIFENGKRVTFEVTKDMYDALKPLSESSILNKPIPVFNQISNIRRGLITEFNPAFMLTNPIRDVQEILINSQHPLKTYKKLPEAFAQIKKKGYWYDEYIKNGGSQNTIFDNEKGTFKTSNKGIARMLEVPPLSTISKINQTIEMLPRLAEYIASREGGASVEVAMLDAARVTTNFKAGGNVTKFLNRNGCTFLNASVQGTMQQIRNFREAKANGIKGYMNLATKFAIAGLPVFLLNHLIWDDDEEYEELSDYIKQNYYVVWKDDNGQFVRVPKGRMLAVIQDGFAQMENLITGNDEVDLDSFLSLVANNVAPTNPADNNILAPINQVRNNETWYGEDLVPTRLQDFPDAEQYDESTDTLSKWLGEKLDISPVKINYLIDQYSGAIGDVFLPMMTPEAESGNDSFGGELIAPIKDKFTADAIMDNQNISDFYDKSDELTKNANSSKATDEDKLKSKYFSSMQSQISALYKQKREIQNSNLKDSKKYKEVRQIQEEIIGLCKEAMENYSNVTIDGNYATVGGVSYRNDNGNWTKVNDDQMSKQQEAMDKFGISGSEYWDNKDEYSYAVDNPEKYLVSQAIADFNDYSKYKKDISKIEADKDENGKSINGSRKEKVIDYINNLDIDRGAKKILIKMNYPSEDKYNEDIVEYLSDRDDISYDEMKTILKELGFTVKSDGTVTW